MSTNKASGYDNISRKCLKLFYIINPRKIDKILYSNYTKQHGTNFISKTFYKFKEKYPETELSHWRPIAVIPVNNNLILRSI